jgi:hypothetical protein
VDAWKAQTLADVTLGKTPEERQAAIQKGHGVFLKFAEANPTEKEALTGFLNTSGLGDHPTVVRFFAWLGKAAAEGPLVGPASGGTGSTREAELAARYPSMVKTA